MTAVAGRDLLDVRLDAFDGPIEVLVELIARRELAIDEISVAQIVDDFVALIRSIEVVELDTVSKFLLVATTLMQIKTRRLLPRDEPIEIDEDLLVDAERDVLLARLLSARTFREVAEVLRDAIDESSNYVARRGSYDVRSVRKPTNVADQVDPRGLATIAAAVIEDAETPPRPDEHIHGIHASVTDAISHVAAVVRSESETTFRALCDGVSRMEAIVRFLAVLELLRVGAIRVAQPDLGSDIDLEWNPGAHSEIVEDVLSSYTSDRAEEMIAGTQVDRRRQAIDARVEAAE